MKQAGRASAPVALITGASRGIGASTAERLAAAGYRVMLTARNPERLVEVRERIEAAGGAAADFACDIADETRVFRVVEEILDRWGRIDVLVNNAGTMDPVGQIAELDPEAVQQHLRINLVGPFAMCRAVLPFFISARRGIVINVSSGVASHALRGWSAYCCSKAALAMLTQVLHIEVAELCIRVFGIRPGMVNTRLTRKALEIKVNRVSELDPGDFLEPAEPARAIAWLCSDAAAGLAGRELDFNDPEFRQLVDG